MKAKIGSYDSVEINLNLGYSNPAPITSHELLCRLLGGFYADVNGEVSWSYEEDSTLRGLSEFGKEFEDQIKRFAEENGVDL